MTSAADALKYAGPTSLFVPTDWVPVTAGDPHPPLRALRAAGAGNVTVVTPGSQAEDPPTYRTLAFAAGETRVGMFIEVTDDATTATGLEGGL